VTAASQVTPVPVGLWTLMNLIIWSPFMPGLRSTSFTIFSSSSEKSIHDILLSLLLATTFSTAESLYPPPEVPSESLYRYLCIASFAAFSIAMSKIKLMGEISLVTGEVVRRKIKITLFSTKSK
jgi:hypothetical protein